MRSIFYDPEMEQYRLAGLRLMEQQKRKRRSPGPQRRRLPPHRALIPALIEVIKSDDSLSKLYAGLLARQVITHSPQLRREYAHQLAEVLERDEEA